MATFAAGPGAPVTAPSVEKSKGKIRILLSTVTCLVREGRATLQVPDTIIAFVKPGESSPDFREVRPGDEVVEVDEDCFCYLRNETPVTGKQSGFMYFTRKGFAHFTPQLRAAFEGSTAGRKGGPGTWGVFEHAARAHFKEVERKRDKLIAKLRSDLATLETFTI